jgi:hypothetical protein
VAQNHDWIEKNHDCNQENPSSYEEKTLSPTLEKKEVLKRKEKGVLCGFFLRGGF